jgi:hypothetical protein
MATEKMLSHRLRLQRECRIRHRWTQMNTDKFGNGERANGNNEPGTPGDAFMMDRTNPLPVTTYRALQSGIATDANPRAPSRRCSSDETDSRIVR